MNKELLKKLKDLLEREQNRPIPYKEISCVYEQERIKEYLEKQEGVINGILLAIQEIE